MPHFDVIVHGEGICVWQDTDAAAALGIGARDRPEQQPIIGFYTTKRVQAADEAAAITLAIASVEEEWRKPGLRRINRSGLPRLEMDRVMLVQEPASSSPKGYAFYSAE